MSWRRMGRTIVFYGRSILLFAVIAAAFGAGVFWFSQKADGEGVEALQDAIRRGSVQCYAIEGRYPPSLDYLEKYYGVQIDRERYDVFYSGFASNIMPDITVVSKDSGEVVK
ncbi:MAG TPA: hypothetical protein H9740_10615 [Candidatus Hungatella pullicola]|nr:hypothetical protein [Candidatus Hungatella pullicola]